MKKRLLTSVLALLACALAAFAQTPQEILSRMEAELEKYDESEGVIMTVDVKMPIVGALSTTYYTLGDKYRMDGELMGAKMVTWSDGVTIWTYSYKDNTVEIDNAKPLEKSESDGDMSLFDGITDGYDVSINKEDSKAWYIQCKKSKSNKDKDAPKKMEVVVRKKDYYPVSLSATMSGISITMRDIVFGVSEKQVAFDANDFPGVKVEDKRKKK